jgi:hypothetical protein
MGSVDSSEVIFHTIVVVVGLHGGIGALVSMLRTAFRVG